jgi:hypothetical protein
MAMLDHTIRHVRPGVAPGLEELNQPIGPGGMDRSSAGRGGELSIPQTEPEAQPSATLRVLLSRGVPPEIAQQAVGNPTLLRQILVALQQHAPMPAGSPI